MSTEVSNISVAIIVAMGENQVIGIDNQLPWHIPEDLKYFKSTTMGKPIVMGRKTFDSIGRPLPGRTNIVVTRNQHYAAEGVRVAHSVDQALAMAQLEAQASGVSEVMVIGGAQLYADCLPIADRLYITKVHASVEGDAFFPNLNWDDWQELDRKDFTANDSNIYNYSFMTIVRKSKTKPHIV
jgi:dihydrofolate reductase